MKKTIYLLGFLPIWLSAQCLDCNDKTKDWRIAAGVTLYNNTQYGSGYIDNDYRPLEFNLRYKFSNNHVIRMSLPIVIKQKLDGSIVNHPGYYGNISLEDYYKFMLSLGAGEHYQMIEHNYNLYGTALGYDYNYSITPAFSAFAGIDFAYYYTERNFDYNGIAYSLSPDNYVSKMYLLEYVQYNEHIYECALKPMAGIRYQYQKLLFEISLGYMFFNYKHVVNNESNKYYPNDNQSFQESEKITLPTIGIQQQLVYQLSLNYTF